MNWFQAIVFGIVSGIGEFLPISSSAHNQILFLLFGIKQKDPVRDLIVHIAIFAALIFASKGLLETIRREKRMASKGARVYNRFYRGNMDFRLVRSAAAVLIIGYLVLSYSIPSNLPIPLVACMLLLNGIILHIPDRMLQGNKDARSMSAFDGFLIGLLGSASAVTGISRIGIQTSVATMRGADKRHAANWALLLSIPMLLLQILLDIVAVFSTVSQGLSAGFLGYFLTAVFSFFGAYAAVSIMKFLSVKTGFAAFSYYSWGCALFLFVLYLI